MARGTSDTPEVEGVEVPPEEKPAEQEAIPEVERLRAQLEAAEKQTAQARQEAEEARRFADEQARKAQSFHGQAQDAELNGVSRALEAAQANAANLKTALQAALEAQDYVRAADIQAEMATVAAREVMLSDGKAALEARKAAPPEVPQFQPLNINDPVEKVARTLSPRSAAWVRAHPETCNPGTVQKLAAAAQYAIEVRGLANDSDEFFRSIEEDLGYRQREPSPQPETGTRQAYRQPANRGLPPVRGAPANSSRRVATPADIPDHPRMAEMAAVAGISLDEYKKQYFSLVQNGEMDDHFGVLH